MKIMDKDQLGVSDTVWLSPLGSAGNLCVSYCVTEVIDIRVGRVCCYERNYVWLMWYIHTL